MIRTLTLLVLIGLTSCQSKRTAQPDAPTPAWTVRPFATVRYAPSVLRLEQGAGEGLPLVMFDSLPQVGERFRASWMSRPIAPYPEAPFVLIMSEDPTVPAILNSLGAPGMWLMVAGQGVFPSQVDWLTRDGGYVEMDIVPEQWQMGKTYYIQGAFRDDRTRFGWVLSPMLEVTIGGY